MHYLQTTIIYMRHLSLGNVVIKQIGRLSSVCVGGWVLACVHLYMRACVHACVCSCVACVDVCVGE